MLALHGSVQQKEAEREKLSVERQQLRRQSSETSRAVLVAEGGARGGAGGEGGAERCGADGA